MEKWEIALNKFIKKWEERKDVVGAIVCGSYITGNPSKHSDIDIHIILDSKVNWRERGNEIIDGFLIEYFANPARKHLEYTEEDYKSRTRLNAHMFYTGKVLFDKTGELNQIIKESKNYIAKKYQKPNKAQIEISKYQIWDMYDNLEEIYDDESKEFYLVYYNDLSSLFESYSKFLQFDSAPIHKLLKFLTNNKDKEKYMVADFPDKEFVKMFSNAIIIKDKSSMIKEYKALTNHVLNKMGGFNIDGWKIRTPVQ